MIGKREIWKHGKNNTNPPRLPEPLPYFGNLIRPLPDTVWAAVFTMIFAMSLVFMAFNRVYRHLDANYVAMGEPRLTLKVSSVVDFPVKTFSTLTEPDLIPWFPRWSAGTLLVALFCI